MIKPVISPAQALLILLKENRGNPILRKWFMSGIEKKDHAAFYKRIEESGILERFVVSTSRVVINEDPSKRYFETLLSYQTIKHSLDNMPHELLDDHVTRLRGILPAKTQGNERKLDQLERALRGEFLARDEDQFKEYGSYIKRVRDKEIFQDLTDEQRDKVILMIQASALSVVNAQTTQVLPIDIYGVGMFDADARGKDPKTQLNERTGKKEQSTTQDYSLGLMKGHMPLSANSVAMAPGSTPMLKATGQATYKDGAAWVENSFDLLVHPHSNSISGTMLAELRNLGRMVRLGNPSTFTESHEAMNEYSKLLIATLQFGTGGHSLFEYSGPLQIDEVKAFFPKAFEQPINVESMFVDGNEDAFNTALEESIEYNDRLIIRQNVREEYMASEKVQTLLEKSPSLKSEYLLRRQSTIKIADAQAEVSDIDRKLMASSTHDYQEKSTKDISSTLDKSSKKLGPEGKRLFGLNKNLKQDELIQERLYKANIEVEKGDYIAAKGIIAQLKTDLVTQFGKKIWGIKTSEAYSLVKSLEKKVNTYLEQHVSQVGQMSQINQLIQKKLMKASREVERSEYSEAKETIASLKTDLEAKCSVKDLDEIKQDSIYGLVESLEQEITVYLNEAELPHQSPQY